jgi:hypothetical protein
VQAIPRRHFEVVELRSEVDILQLADSPCNASRDSRQLRQVSPKRPVQLQAIK